MSLPRNGVQSEYNVSKAGTSGEYANWLYNTGELWDGTSRLIIALHGHVDNAPTLDAQTPLHFNQNLGPGSAATALARSGRYVVLSIQAAGSAAWSSANALTSITAAVSAAKTRGVSNGRYGVLGWSMGGLTAANRLKRFSTEIAAMWTWAPAIDLDYVYSTAGHSRQANVASWTAEVNTAFGAYSASAGYRVFDEPASYRGLGVPWKICHATDDGIIPYGISTDFIAAVNDPNIKLRTPDVTGNHTGLFANVPDAEVVAFYDASTRW